jgi:hypothetical protein
MKKIYLFLTIAFCSLYSMGQIVINPKGTKLTIDSSKWKIVGANIFFKNSGNVGIGTNTPTAQLHTTNTVRFQGLGTNTLDTKILTTDANGNVTTRLISSLPTNIDSTTSNNGLTLVGKNIQLGGNLIQSTIISNNEKALTFSTGGADLNITGLSAGTTIDSILTVNTTTGKVNRINTSSFNKNDSTTSNNGVTLTGKNIQLGGNLIQATTITNNANPLTIATGGAAFNITGLTAGTTTDSILTVNTTTGKVNRINTSSFNKNDSTTSNNGVTLTGKNIQLGGNLIQATTITNNANPLTIATGGAALNITGLTAGAVTDSIVTINTTTGKINRITFPNIINRVDSTTSNNGLTLTGKNVQLGGNLIQATTITNNANPLTIATGGAALNITGLTAGAATDSILTVSTTTGKVNRINTSSFSKNDSTTSNNGITLTGKNIQLGGNLIQATTITNNANPLTISTGGTAFNITGLPSGASTDSLVVINNITGQLRKTVNNQPSLIEIFDGLGTQTLTSTFSTLNFGTTNISDAGYTSSLTGVTISNAGLYKITLRVTTRVTNNTNSSAEFQLTNAGGSIFGTIGYTYNRNADNSRGSVTIVKIVNLNAGSVIAAQGRRFSANGNLALVPNGSSLLIEKIR